MSLYALNPVVTDDGQTVFSSNERQESSKHAISPNAVTLEIWQENCRILWQRLTTHVSARLKEDEHTHTHHRFVTCPFVPPLPLSRFEIEAPPPHFLNSQIRSTVDHEPRTPVVTVSLARARREARRDADFGISPLRRRLKISIAAWITNHREQIKKPRGGGEERSGRTCHQVKSQGARKERNSDA